MRGDRVVTPALQSLTRGRLIYAGQQNLEFLGLRNLIDTSVEVTGQAIAHAGVEFVEWHAIGSS